MLIRELIILAAVLFLLLVLYRLTVRYQRRRARRMQPPVTSDIVNTTNYNLKSEEALEEADLDEKDARAVIQNWRRSEQIPAPRDFYRVKRVVREEE